MYSVPLNTSYSPEYSRTLYYTQISRQSKSRHPKMLHTNISNITFFAAIGTSLSSGDRKTPTSNSTHYLRTHQTTSPRSRVYSSLSLPTPPPSSQSYSYRSNHQKSNRKHPFFPFCKDSSSDPNPTHGLPVPPHSRIQSHTWKNNQPVAQAAEEYIQEQKKDATSITGSSEKRPR